LHSLIFTLMGIFFWKWIWMDLCLLLVVWRMKQPLAELLFSRKNLAYSLATITGIFFVIEPWGQGSLNTSLTATYRFEAVGESGNRYALSSGSFAPYDVIFAQRRFYCLSDRAPIVSTFGSTKKWKMHQAILNLGPESQAIDQLIDANHMDDSSKRALQVADAKLVHQFDQFVRKFVRAKLAAGKPGLMNHAGPFRHILQSPKGAGLDPCDWQEPITRIDVFEVRKYLDAQAIHTLKDELCHRVHLDESRQIAERPLSQRR